MTASARLRAPRSTAAELLAFAIAAAGAVAACASSGASHAAPDRGASDRAAPRDRSARVRVPAGFEIHGHRGARGRYPENTIDGFVAALRDGAEVIETDLLLTRDRVLVIHHNYELNPDTTRDETGRWLEQPSAPILTMSAADLLRYDVGRLRPGSAYAARFADQRPHDGARIPTLADALAAIERASGGRARYNLEIKIATEHPERTAEPREVADATVAMLRERGLEGRVMIQSFDWRAVRHVQAIAPSIPTGCLTSPDTVRRAADGPSKFNAGLDLADVGGSVPRLVHAAGCRYWTPELVMLTPAIVDEAHRLGLHVVPWTVNELDDLRRVVSLGTDGVITDYPDRVAKH